MDKAIPACFRVASTVPSPPELREEMGEARLAAASQLTWEAAARQMMAVMQKVMAG